MGVLIVFLFWKGTPFYHYHFLIEESVLLYKFVSRKEKRFTG